MKRRSRAGGKRPSIPESKTLATPAPTTGGTPYCESRSKIAWPTVEAANEMVESLKSQPGARKPYLLESYRCPAGIGWHVGHNYKLQWISLCIGEHK